MPKHLQKKVSCHDLKLICDAYNGDQPPIDNQFVADGCEKFAPAPEEAVPCKHSDDVNCRSCHVGEATGEVKEPAPEWRELGPDEVIQMDDMYRNDVSSRNYPVTSVMIGKPVGNFPFPEYSFRTRRPLPKQEGEQPYCSRCRYNHAFPCEGSIAGVPLEDELSAIEDSEGWDGGSELSRIEKAYNRVLNERKAEESASPDNEVARLRWEIKISEEDGITPYLWDNRKYDNYDLGSLCRILNEYEEKTNEVATLMELLNKVTDLAESLSGYYYASLCDMQECPAKKWGKVHQKLLADNLEHFKKEARLAPAPKEPVNPTCANTTHKFSHCDCEKPTPIEPAPELRELGPDEEIHTGDEVQAKHHDRLHGVWLNVFPYEVGAMPIDHEAFRYRTRRPLPKQEEMPLEKEIVRLQEVGRLNYAEGQQDLTDCLRYLRDEIEALKKNQK